MAIRHGRTAVLRRYRRHLILTSTPINPRPFIPDPNLTLPLTLSLKPLTLACQARKTIKAGCEACPDNEDVWLEGARLQTPENAKTVLANAIRNLPTSVKIWLRAAELESNPSSKKVRNGIYRKYRYCSWQVSTGAQKIVLRAHAHGDVM